MINVNNKVALAQSHKYFWTKFDLNFKNKTKYIHFAKNLL